jgi:phosphatidylserine/phosphatidylglycerophosphate/cardiolipin synthase-like enzyme
MRTAIVRHNTETTYVVPGDWPQRDGTKWFDDHSPPLGGSTSHELIDGRETFDAMWSAMRTATKKGHFVVLIGWGMEHDFVFADGKTFVQALENRAAQGVAIRVLLFRDEKAVNAINELRKNPATADVFANTDNYTRLPIGTGNPELKAALARLHQIEDATIAVRDWWTGTEHARAVKTPYGVGSHHQKILLVNGEEGLIAFCGGVDIAGNRLGLLHDVHARFTGDAAWALWKITQERWADSGDYNAGKDVMVPPTPPSLDPIAPPTPVLPPKTATNLVRVFRTVGNPKTWARGATDTLWPALKSAIRSASQYIYIEDQYFWSRELMHELADASTRVKHITVLLSIDHVLETAAPRHRALQELLKVGGKDIQKRISLFEVKRGQHEWIHAKMFIFDDNYAIIGSANANNRGYFVDSEVSAGIAEYAWNNPVGPRGAWYSRRLNLARRLRIRLWSEHLRLPPEEVFDPIGSRLHWESPPAGSPVEPYEPTNLRDFTHQVAAHERAFREWQEGGMVGPAPMEPYRRMPWWLVPYDEWNNEPDEDLRKVPAGAVLRWHERHKKLAAWNNATKTMTDEQKAALGDPLTPFERKQEEEEGPVVREFFARTKDQVRDLHLDDVVDPQDPEKQDRP